MRSTSIFFLLKVVCGRPAVEEFGVGANECRDGEACNAVGNSMLQQRQTVSSVVGDESLSVAQMAKLQSTMKRASDVATIDMNELKVVADLAPNLAGECTKWFPSTNLARLTVSWLTRDDMLESAMLALKDVSADTTGNFETTIAGNEVRVKDALCALSTYTDGKATSTRRLCSAAPTTSLMANNKCSGPENICSLGDMLQAQSDARAEACTQATLLMDETSLQKKMDSMVKLLEEDASSNLEFGIQAAEYGTQMKKTCTSSFWQETGNLMEDYGKKEKEVSAGL